MKKIWLSVMIIVLVFAFPGISHNEEIARMDFEEEIVLYYNDELSDGLRVIYINKEEGTFIIWDVVPPEQKNRDLAEYKQRMRKTQGRYVNKYDWERSSASRARSEQRSDDVRYQEFKYKLELK